MYACLNPPQSVCTLPSQRNPINYSAGDAPRSVAVGDFNADGKADLATANQNSENVTILLNCTNPVPPPVSGPFAITGVTAINCTPVGNRVDISFTPQYAGPDGQPITFSVVNEAVPTTNPGPYAVALYVDNPVITLEAIQSGTTTTFAYNWRAGCGSPRIGVEPGIGLQVRILGNPVQNAVDFEVTGAEGSALGLSLTTMQGRIVDQQQMEQAGTIQRH